MPSTFSPNSYDIGDRVKLSIEVRDLEDDDALIDPTALVFTMLEPGGTTTSYEYGADAEVVRDGLGLFRVEWDVVQAGTHWCRWAAAGNVGAAEERGFKVRPSRVLGG